MTRGEWGKIKAFFDVRTSEGFVMKGFKIIEGINGPFVGMPSQKGKDEEYNDTIYAERELKDELSQMAMEYYGQEVMPINSTQPEDTSEAPMGMEVSGTNETSSDVNDDSSPVTDDDIPF